MNEENKQGSKRTKSAREIEADIGETRDALREDIKALSDKVSPNHMKQEAKDAIKDAADHAREKANELRDVALDKAMEVKDVVVDKATEMKGVMTEKAVEVKDSMVEAAQHAAEAISTTADQVNEQARRAGTAAWSFTVDNAVPLSLIGVGAGWLIANQRRDRAPRMYPSVARNAAPRFESSSGRSRSLRSTGNGSDRYSGANRKSGVGERAQALYEQAGTKLDRAEDAMLEGAARGRDVIQEKWMQARQASRDLAQDNPLALALGTLVLGIGVGMLLPATTRENALLGPTRDKLNRAMSQVRGTARDLGTVAADTAKQSMADLEGRVHH